MRVALRTTGLFLVLTLVLAAIGALIGYIVGYFSEGGFVLNYFLMGIGIMALISVLMSIYSYFNSKKIVLRNHKVRLVTEAEEPRLFRIVRNVAQKAGIPMPEVGITDNSSPNAFATGRGPKDAAVVVTSGILRLLNDDELEGVVAHEVAHIKNRDVLIMSIAATVAGLISFLANYLIWISILSRNSRNNNGLGIALALIGYITLPIAALLIQTSISRGREFGADKGGAEFTGNPMALASALKKLEYGIASTPMDNDKHHENYSDAHLWIEPPAAKGKRGFMSSLFSTHPRTEDRVKRLEEMARKMGRNITEQNNPFL